ncbi:MAG: glycosyltransferase, partial [Anaerolineae bacterium]
ACVLLYTRFFEFPVSRVIDVLQLVRMRVPRAWLLVVGKGLFGEEEELFRLCSESGLSLARVSSHNTKKAPTSEPRARVSGADVVYAGWAPPAALPAYFAEAAVAVYPFDDTLVNRAKCPVKLGDLLAAGVPVVAEAVGQNREYIRDGETGFLVKPGDTRSFADAVVQLLKDADLRGRIGLAAARDVQERFAWDELIDAVERAYGVRS